MRRYSLQWPVIQRRILLVCNVGRWDTLETYLAITRSEGHPSGARPPGDDEAEEPSILWTRALSTPYVNGTAERKRRANFCQDRRRDEHEDHRDNVRRPGVT